MGRLRRVGSAGRDREHWRDTALVNCCRLTGGARASFASYAAIGARNCLDCHERLEAQSVDREVLATFTGDDIVTLFGFSVVGQRHKVILRIEELCCATPT